MVRNPVDNVLTHNAILVLISCALLYFITLGAREVQPWDEALYATRARAVAEKGLVWDQSSAALGAAHTATEAPFSVWAMAQFIKPMKMTPLSVRLFSVLCAIASLFLLYDIASKVLPRKIAILAPVLLSASIGWNHYARLGMPDVPLVCCVLLSLFALLRAQREDDSFRRLLYLALYAVGIALSLLMKVSASLLPLSFVLLPWLQRRFGAGETESIDGALRHFASPQTSHLRSNTLGTFPLLLSALLGLAIAAPWYIAMFLQHPTELLWNMSSAFHPASPPSVMSWLGFAFHNIVVQQPASVFALAWIAYALRIRREFFRHSLDAGLEVLLGLWLAVGLVICTLLPTKSDVYVMLLLPPTVMLSLRGLELCMQYSSRSRAGVLIYTLAVVAVVWSLAAPIRLSVFALFHGSFSILAIVFIVLLPLVLLLSVLGKSERRLARSIMFNRAFHSAVPIILILRVAALNIWSVDECERGAAKTAKWLKDSECTEFVFVAHKSEKADTLCPQLSWYTQGWAGYSPSPWTPTKRFRTVLFKRGEVDSTAIELLYAENVPIVYERPAEDSLMAWDSRYLSRFQTLRLRTQNYIVFSRRSYLGTMEGLDAELREP